MLEYWLGMFRRLSLLPMLLLVGACSSGGDDIPSCNPPPQISGVPPTTATVGVRYEYDYTATYVCQVFICHDAEEVQLPPGAIMDHFRDAITWTPAANLANSDVTFVIATPPDRCFLGGGNRAVQSWTVRVLADSVPPTITSVGPANGSASVPVNSTISAFFSEPINPLTVTAASFVVSGLSGPIAGNLQIGSSSVSFVPGANLPSVSAITVTVTTSVADANGNGLASDFSWSFMTALAPDTSPPTPPSGLSAAVRGSEIDLSWSASVDDRAVSRYRVYRDGALAQTITNLALLVAEETGLNFNTSYCYTVTALDSSLNESNPSSPLCVTTLDFLPGAVASWGHTVRANGTTWARTIPDIVPGLSGVQSIAVGRLAAKSDGTVWKWVVAPAQVAGLSNATAVAAGSSHSLAIRTDGSVWSWGANNFGQLGDGTTTDSVNPVQMLNLGGIIAAEGGYSHSLALKSDGTVWAAGANFQGQLGDGTTTPRLAAVQVPNLNGVVAVAAGQNQSLALKSDGTVWIWGGTSGVSFLTTPSQVPGLANVTAIAQGEHFSLVVRVDGTVWAWGTNNSGQLGDGTTTSRTAPVQVTGLSNIIAVAAGSNHSMALRADGTVWAWGYNGFGQLGDGTIVNRNVPVQVLKVSQARAIAAGGYASLALR